MAVARSNGAFIGTSESTTVASIANNAVNNGSEIDVLGDNTSMGWVHVYLCYDSTSASGTIDIKINRRRVSGQAYSNPSYDIAWPPVNGSSNKVYIGCFHASRYMTADIKNNAIGAAITNVALLYELEKLS